MSTEPTSFFCLLSLFLSLIVVNLSVRLVDPPTCYLFDRYDGPELGPVDFLVRHFGYPSTQK